MIDDYVISLQTNYYVNNPKNCYACGDHILDPVYVKVAVYGQEPLLFHDGYCMIHFTTGLMEFVNNRDKMEAKALQ